jgi:hypothetical protein
MDGPQSVKGDVVVKAENIDEGVRKNEGKMSPKRVGIRYKDICHILAVIASDHEKKMSLYTLSLSINTLEDVGTEESVQLDCSKLTFTS